MNYQIQVVVLFGAAVLSALLFRVIRVPGIIGFLLTGIAIGPSGLNVITGDDVSQFADIGLVLLLFVIGLELSPAPLLRAGKRLAGATLLQVLSTVAVTALVLWLAAGFSWGAAGIIGVAVSLSSTAIVLKQLDDRGETNSTTGMIATGVLLLQDVIVIAFMLVLSMLSPVTSTAAHAPTPLRTVLGLAGLVVGAWLARRALPWLVNRAIEIGGRELVSLMAVLGAAGGAWLATLAGWSPALGAGVAGFFLAGADHRHQMVAEILPFRNVFNAVFFISLGMLVNVQAVITHLPLMLVAVTAVLLVKPLLTAGALTVAGWPLRIGLHVGIGLCTISEFGYVLAYDAYHRGLLPETLLDFMVACTVATMMVGAFIFPFAGPVASAIAGLIRPRTPKTAGEESGEEPLNNHVIIVGYGLTGANLAKMLQATRVPCCVIEMNQALIQKARAAGVTVIAGDAARMTILEVAGVDAARVLVVAINDRLATRRIVAQVAARLPRLYILARSNIIQEIDPLQSLGARLVIPEDLETSIEVAAHVLRQYGIPDNIVEAQIASVRAGGYAVLRGRPVERAAHRELIQILQRTTTQTFYLTEENSACGMTIADLNLRARTGCMIIAVVRNGDPTTNPAPEFVLQANDVLVLVGAHKQLEAAKEILGTEPELLETE